MRLSDQVDKLLPALAAIQDSVEVKKTKENPFHKTRYADLEAIYKAAHPELKEQGLVAVQTVDDEGCTPGQVLIITRIFHIESSQWVESRFRMDAKSATPQDLGSAVTYTRRYSLLTALGLTPEDDDGERAQSRYRNNKVTPQPQPLSLTFDQEVKNIMRNANLTQADLKPLYDEYKVESLKAIPAIQQHTVLARLKFLASVKESAAS